MVFVGQEEKPRCKSTPCKFDIDKGSGNIDVKLFAKRYKWETRSVPTDSNQSLDVTLEKEKTTTTTTHHHTTTTDDGGDADDVMDPFHKKKPH